MDLLLIINILTFISIGLFTLHVRTYVKSTVEKTVGHQFDIKLEKFKQDFSKEMMALERKDKYRLAALDKRLEAHQIAFRLSIEMFENLHAELSAHIEFLLKLKEFWKNYSLYLTNDARKAFKKGWNYYGIYPTLVQVWRLNHEEKYYQQLDEKFNYLLELPQIIAKEVDLEAMELEVSQLIDKKITPTGIEEKPEENL
jgi:hypothetical protein